MLIWKQKLVWNRTNIEGWLKTVAGFSNAEGGSFFLSELKTERANLLDLIERSQTKKETFSTIR